MTAQEIQDALQTNMGNSQGFDPAVAQQFATNLAGAISAAGGPNPNPTANQQACYAQCQQTRDAAFAACALTPWPGNLICVGQAVLAFNACRAKCDQNP